MGRAPCQRPAHGGGCLMIDRGRHDILGVMVSAVDYASVVNAVVDAAIADRPLAVSALAVHGVMTGALDPEHRARLNALDILTPDGQPVRWTLNLLHGVRLRERVYGPTLTLRLCEAAAERGLPVFFYGSRPEVLANLSARLTDRFPKLTIAGSQPSRFRQLTEEERLATVADIRSSGAKIVFVGLGCPRQEVWAYEMRDDLSMPILAVGAAFDFHAGTLAQAPAWMQRAGMEWFYRLLREPRRLGRRYLVLGPLYVREVLRQRFAGAPKCNSRSPVAPRYVRYG